MVLLDLDELETLQASLKRFSVDRFNLTDFRQADHLAGGPEGLKGQVETILHEAGFETGGRIRLLCMPRVLGAVFNPLSVYYCETQDGRLQAVLYEVNNTFGQRHSYLLAAPDGNDDAVEHGCAKRFYVSPFNGMNLAYDFQLRPPGPEEDAAPLYIRVNVRDADGLLMSAAFSGARLPLTDAAIMGALGRHPLLAAKVVGGIHWEALKLGFKGMGLTRRPPPPTTSVTGPAETAATAEQTP